MAENSNNQKEDISLVKRRKISIPVVSKITMKNGGGEVKVFRPKGTSNELFMQHARKVSEANHNYDFEPVGHAIILWDENGDYTLAYYVNFNEKQPFRTLEEFPKTVKKWLENEIEGE